MEQATSLIALITTIVGAGFAVQFALKRLRARWAVFLFVVCLWAAFLWSWWFVDVDFPLPESRYRYSNGTPPIWLSIMVWFIRYAALAALIMSFPKSPAAGPNKPSQPIAREDARSG